MSLRQIVLDTETTGLRVEDGHRIIEIGCVELIDRKLTGKSFHYYFNPMREIEAGAVAVHGLTTAFLQDKPLFENIASELLEFIANAELIIHNAPFDTAFLNYELSLIGKNFKKINDYCSVIDTLQLARKLHVGQRNNLDALCKRYGIDNTKRELHGALLDAHLLTQVYLAMTGGQGSFFDHLNENSVYAKNDNTTQVNSITSKADLVVIKADVSELKEHAEYLQTLQSRGQCLWLEK